MENTNPLFCDFENGTCELPETKAVQIDYFTDPICSACWGIEPSLRKLKLEYGAYVNITYHMGGLLPSWNGFNGGGITKPSDVAYHWDEASRYYQMPINGDIWLEDPLDSSYPPSIAFIAAKMQDNTKSEKFLRRVKEMVFFEKKNIAKGEHIHQAAVEAGLDIAKFKEDLDGRANESFRADLGLARSLGVRSFPTLFFKNDAGERQVLKGVRPYESFEQVILHLCPAAEKAMPPAAEDIFSYYPTLTTKEFSVIVNRTMEASQAFLQGLVDKDMLMKVSGKNGEIWKVPV